MADEEYIVECCSHGKAQATFVCNHILEGTYTNWYSSEPYEEDPYPDAWFGICHKHFEKEGEWNKSSEAAAGGADSLKILCCHCYTKRKKQFNVHCI